MKITKKNQAINRVREDGSDITYYIFDQYEIHYGIIAPGVTQPWHHHQKISESLFIISGQVVLHYFDGKEKKEKIVSPGDVIEVENTPHTFSNPFDHPCIMIAFRFLPGNEKTQHIIKEDKVLDSQFEDEN